jgi:hypothetical protein
VLGAIVGATLVGVIRGANVSWFVFLLAALCAAMSAAVYATEYFMQADPFNEGCARETRDRLTTPQPVPAAVPVSD